MSEISKLKRIRLFRNMDEKTLESLAPLLIEERAKDGQVIFSEDEPGDRIYFVISGEVEIVKDVDKKAGVSRSLSLLGEGDFFGEMALFGRKQRSATVRAKGEAVLLKMGSKDFYDFLKKDADTAVTVLSGMLAVTIERLREMDMGFVTIYETGRLLASRETIPNLLNGVLDQIMEVVPSCERGLIVLWNEFSELFELQSVKGYGREEVHLKKDDGVVKWLKENKTRLIIEDVMATSRFSPDLLPGYCGVSFIVQPFIHREELLGFFLVSNISRKIEAVRSQLNLLSGIASQVAPVIANAKKVTEEENRKRLQRAKTWK